MVSLVIDIQSDLIQGALVSFQKNVHAKKLYATSVSVPRKLHVTGEYITKMMLRGVGEITKDIILNAKSITKEPIHSIHYVLSSPWAISQSKTVKIQYDKDTEISESMVEDIIEENRRTLVDKYEEDMILVEEKIFSVELNGYSVTEYNHKKAKTLEISFAFTLSSEKLIKKIQAAVSDIIDIKREHYHSAILLQYVSSRAHSTHNEEYILVHVHGELTDIVVIKKGFTSHTASFPFGVSTLVRKMASSFKNTLVTANSTLALYTDNKLDDTHRTRVEKTLINVMKGWYVEYDKALEQMSKEIILPRKVYIASGCDHCNIFKDTLKLGGFEVIEKSTPIMDLYISALGDVL
jgi:cell division ATPase FtsA